ncbi:MAG: serine protease [Acidobacteria bacterium]|nr:serine protease [Acidobacteriota bacterium]
MPPIPKQFLDCSVYLYNSEQAAKDGESFGGSGFLVHILSEHEGMVHLYAVTNKHVIDQGFQVLRLNTAEGSTGTITSQRDSWRDHPDGYDVSVLPVEMEGERFRWFSVGIAKFITREIITDYQIGPGDDAFLIGRLVTPWGQQRNIPAVRFGNISMMADPNELVRGYSGMEQESFFVDCRSLSGFSGSPVFALTTRAYFADEHYPNDLMPEPHRPNEEGIGLTITPVATEGTFGPWLLGIDWGHLPLWKSVYEKDETTPTDYKVEQNTGIACVLPAWHILDLLNERELVIQRKRNDDEITCKKQGAAISDIEELGPGNQK